MAVTYAFTAGTKIKSAEVGQNFTDLQSKVVFMKLNGPSVSNTTSTYVGGNNGKFTFQMVTGNVSSIVFRALLQASGGVTCYAQLYNESDSSALAGSEITNTGATDTWVSSGDIKAQFPTSIKNYKIEVKNSDNVTSVVCISAYLVITYK